MTFECTTRSNLRPARYRDFGNCVAGKITGFTYDGGYVEYMVAPVEAVASMPASLDPAEAAPLLCAGITTFNALRHSGAMTGDLVAVEGLGGLGHLGVQFASKFGYRVAGHQSRKRSGTAGAEALRPRSVSANPPGPLHGAWISH